jgi:uncharacterized membrane protein
MVGSKVANSLDLPASGLGTAGMTWRHWYALIRVAPAALGLIAIVAQFSQSVEEPDTTVVDFLSYFTYQSNFVTAIVLLVGAWRLWTLVPDTPTWDLVRGAVVTWISLTGIVHATLPMPVHLTGPAYSYAWASNVLHIVIPIAVFIDWLVMPPDRRIPYRHALLWTLFPLAFCAYSLVRGEFADWYPYPFLDHREDGWLCVWMYVVGVSLGFLISSWVVIAVGDVSRHWQAARPQHRLAG